MQYWRLPATECADKAAPRNHHSRKTLTTGYPETGKPRPHSRMTEASALEGQPRRGREYADMQVPKYPHIGSPKLTSGNAFQFTPDRGRSDCRLNSSMSLHSCLFVSIHVPLTRYDTPKRSHHHSLMFPCWQESDPGGLDSFLVTCSPQASGRECPQASLCDVPHISIYQRLAIPLSSL